MNCQVDGTAYMFVFTMALYAIVGGAYYFDYLTRLEIKENISELSDKINEKSEDINKLLSIIGKMKDSVGNLSYEDLEFLGLGEETEDEKRIVDETLKEE